MNKEKFEALMVELGHKEAFWLVTEGDTVFLCSDTALHNAVVRKCKNEKAAKSAACYYQRWLP